MGTEKVMSYLEKSVGSTAFFKCEACPYMALAEDDIKFHLFTAHPELARRNGLADNIHIPCPGCAAVFSADATLRTHLRTHHRMGVKDVKKMVRSLVHIALKHAKLKKEARAEEATPPALDADVKMPQVIEIVPDLASAGANLPKGVAYISVDELNKMSTPNFEKVDPKDIIQEASINIVYTNDVSGQYINMSEPGPSSATHSMIQMSGVPPDLISSIQPRVSATLEPSLANMPPPQPNPPHILKPEELNQEANKQCHEPTNGDRTGTACMINGCQICLKEEKNLAYHRRCHQGGKLVCVECGRVLPSSEALHTHLWKLHAVDLELPTCPLCGYKTYRRYRLLNIHMKCHGDETHVCGVCSKSFKSGAQLGKHRLTHAGRAARCSLCPREFRGARRLAAHVAAVHHKVRPYRCEHCPYQAARKDDLKRHLRAHTGDKPYACSRCDFRAADHNSMRRHRKMHSKSGLYACKHCSYTTIQSTVFAAHVLAAHPEAGDVHRCPGCAFKTVSREQLAQHLASHGPAPEPAPPTDVFHCDSPAAPAAPFETGAELAAESALLAEPAAPAAALPAYIRLPPPHSIMLTPADQISLAASRSGPILAPTQMLPAPASSPAAEDGAPRKKPKISVKSNLILKGPDQDAMFQQQQMAFQRLEGQFGLGAPVTFNNLISTQFLQLPPEGQFEAPAPPDPAYIKLEGRAGLLGCKSELPQDELAYLLGEQYALLDAPDVIEIDDNSDDSKVLPRFDSFPLDSLYLAHELLEPELAPDAPAEPESVPRPEACLQGRRDPMMNTTAARATKINVKNIELMKN